MKLRIFDIPDYRLPYQHPAPDEQEGATATSFLPPVFSNQLLSALRNYPQPPDALKDTRPLVKEINLVGKGWSLRILLPRVGVSLWLSHRQRIRINYPLGW